MLEGAITGRALYDGRLDRQGSARPAIASKPDATAMLKTRIIPCLDVKDGRVVKGVNFVDLIDAGDPVEAAAAYDAAGADELCFLDITASHENRDTIFDVVERTAERCFMPLTVGGGVRTLDDIAQAAASRRRQGSINTAAVNNRQFVAEAAEKFGAQCIVVAIDAKRVSRPGEAAALGDLHARRPQADRASTPSNAPGTSPRSARARSCSPPWTATAPRPASTSS